LTIKSISNTKYSMSFFLRAASPLMETCVIKTATTIGKLAITCSKYCPSNIRLSKIRLLRYCYPKTPKINFPVRRRKNHLRFLRYCPDSPALTLGAEWVASGTAD
jgi:hypothetical protein